MLHEYDPRDLQRKALERWERQQETWSKIEQRLQTQRLFSQSHHVHINNSNNRTPNKQEEQEKQEEYYLQSRIKVSPREEEGGPKDQSHHAKDIMNTCSNKNNNKKNASTILHAPTEGRKKREANQIICMANNSTNFSGNIAWEDTLRRSSHDVSSVRRSVPIGKTTYPYVLYGQVSNNYNNGKSVDRQSDLAFTRIIHSDEVSNSEVENNDYKNSVNITDGNYGNTFPQPSSKTSRVREKLQKQLTSNYVADEYKDVERKAESYIAQHARSLTPSVKKQIAHLTKPRHFLQVVGHATPVKANTTLSMVENRMEKSNEKYQEQQQQTSAVQPQMEWMESVPLQTPSLAHKDEEENIMNDTNNNNNQHTSTDASNVPFLSLSSRRLIFYAKPLQLVHQTLEIENTSSVTVYYTMTPIDTWQEIIEEEEQQQEEEGEGEKAKEQESNNKELLTDKEMENLEVEQQLEGQDKNNGAVSSLSLEHTVTSTLHKLATHHAQCINFFYLSNESNGVMYPMSSVQFAFSLRSPNAGRFRQTYELLTVPASSTRILIELIGLVEHDGAPLHVLTSPLHDALEHKAVVNEQKQMVRGVINAHDPYEAAELESAIMAIHTATEEKEKAQRAVVAQHRQMWDETNALNVCDVPFNGQVYDAFISLHDHVCTTLSELSCPLPCNEWNGSIHQLIGLLSMLRDNALRELLYDGVMVLLRASRVSLHEDEPLQLLLHRAAVVCVLDEERRGVLAHSNKVLDWQAQCEDDVLNKLEVLHNNDDGTINTTTQANANSNINKRKSRSISPPSVSIPDNNSMNNNNNIKSTRSNKLSARVNVINNTNNHNTVPERNANRSNLMTQKTTTSSLMMTKKNSQGRKANEQVGSINDNDNKLADEEDNINVSLLANNTNDVVVDDDNVLGLKQEYEILMKEYIYTQIQRRENKIHDVHRRFCSLVEVCCSLPLLHVVHAARAEDIAIIQSAKEIEVDTSNPAFATSSMIGISANGTTMLADGMNAKSSTNSNSTNNNSARTSKRR